MKSLRSKQPSTKSSSPRPPLADDEEAMPTHYELIGLQDHVGKGPVLFIGHPGAPPAEAIAVPLTLCTTSRHGMLEEHLMKSGFVKALNSTQPKAIAAQFREFAAATQVRVLDSEGIHKLKLSGSACCVLVKAGICHWLTPMPKGAAVVLVGKACSTARRTGAHKKFKKVFGVLLCGSPRLLVVLLFALAAWLASEFGVVLLALALLGPSSIGKTCIQRAVSLLVDGRGRVRHFDGTVQGVIEFIQAAGASAVNFEDVHDPKVVDVLCHAIMAAGNGSAERLRSSYSRQAS